MKSFVSIVFVLVSCQVFSQKINDEKEKQDTVRNKFFPTGIRFGTDLISLGKTRYVESFSGWELNADVDFHRYFLDVDVGSGARAYHPNDSNDYSNSGKYFRAGVDVNFLKKDVQKNMFFLGFRYGRSVFSENYTTIVADTTWGDGIVRASNTNVSARWLELTGGLRIKLWKFIWMGYTARFKFALKTGKTPTLLPHDVPGYGRTDKETTWGFNYQIFIRLPITSKK